MRKISPLKWGLAIMAVSKALSDVGGISQFNGGHGTLVSFCVFAGFFMGLVGAFITTLYSRDKTKPTKDKDNEAEIEH